MIDDTKSGAPPAGGPEEAAEEGAVPGCVAALKGAACAPEPETDGGNGGGNGWWRSMMATARTQSASVMGFMRRDLSEFVNVVRDDTKDAVQRTAGIVRESVNRDTANEASSRFKSGINRFLDTLSSAVTIPPDDSGEETLVFREGEWHPANRHEARILSLQMDAKTFDTVPEDEQYPTWYQSFDVDAKKVQISEFLVSNSTIRANYTRLVPNTILHREFWARYYFRLEALEKEEARWKALKERAERQDASANDWGDDWDEEATAGGGHAASEAAPTAGASAVPEVTSGHPQDATPTGAGEGPSATALSDDGSATAPAADESTAATDQSATGAATGAEATSGAAVTAAAEAVVPEADADQFRVTEKTDVVVVKHKDSPESSSEGSGSAGVPDTLSESNERQQAVLDTKDLEEWEAELDVEVTAEEIEEAKRTARELKDANELDDDEDWENWE